MNRVESISGAIIQAVELVLTASGRNPPTLSIATPLLGEETGLDSLNGLEVLSMIDVQFEVECTEKVLLPITNGVSPTIGEVANRIAALLEGQNAQSR